MTTACRPTDLYEAMSETPALCDGSDGDTTYTKQSPETVDNDRQTTHLSGFIP
jgi:hypothetical protein